MSYYFDYFNSFEQNESSLLEKQDNNFLVQCTNNKEEYISKSPFLYDQLQTYYNIREEGLFSPKLEDTVRTKRTETKKSRVTNSEDNILILQGENQNQLKYQQTAKNNRLLRRTISKNRRKSCINMLTSENQNQFTETKGNKRLQQMIRNRVSAQISRDRKKEYITQLQENNDQLKKENEILKNQIKQIAQSQSNSTPIQLSYALIKLLQHANNTQNLETNCSKAYRLEDAPNKTDLLEPKNSISMHQIQKWSKNS